MLSLERPLHSAVGLRRSGADLQRAALLRAVAEHSRDVGEQQAHRAAYLVVGAAHEVGHARRRARARRDRAATDRREASEVAFYEARREMADRYRLRYLAAALARAAAQHRYRDYRRNAVVAAACAAHDRQLHAGHARLCRRRSRRAYLKRHGDEIADLFIFSQNKSEIAALKAARARRLDALGRYAVVHLDALPDKILVLAVHLVRHLEDVGEERREAVVREARRRAGGTLLLERRLSVRRDLDDVRMAALYQAHSLVLGREYRGEDVDAAPVLVAVYRRALLLDPRFGLLHILGRRAGEHLQAARGVAAYRPERRRYRVPARAARAGNADGHAVLINIRADRDAHGRDVAPVRELGARACHRERHGPRLGTSERRLYFAAQKFLQCRH